TTAVLVYSPPLIMTYRLARGEKEKWISDPTRPVRRAPVKLPATNNRDLIEEHKLTLIGRVTNPKVQKTRALQGRVRVLINGLKPLEMKLEISTPSGAIKQAELEYEQLQKHCFSCLSLSHEVEDCPASMSRVGRDGKAPNPGISQTRTLERLDAEKRRKDQRKSTHYASGFGNRGNYEEGSFWEKGRNNNEIMERDWRRERNFRYDYGTRRDPHSKKDFSLENRRAQFSRSSAKERLSFTRGTPAASQGASSHESSHTRNTSNSQRSEWRRVTDAGHREPPSRSILGQNPVTPQKSPQFEGLAAERATNHSDDRGNELRGRKSALERLSYSGERVTLLQEGVANVASGRLQEVNGDHNIPSNLKHQRLPEQNPPQGITDRSPIRTLSEDRIHVSLRLGPVFSPEENAATLHKGKRATAFDDVPLLGNVLNRTTAATSSKRPGQRTNQGVSVKKRRVTKGANASRRRTPSNSRQTATTPSTSSTGTQAQTHERRTGPDFQAVPPVGLSGGLALSWKDNVEVDVLLASPNNYLQWKTFFVSYIYGS
ncbi:unnamed protein product, partial [Brassica oleracea var. botrytis]